MRILFAERLGRAARVALIRCEGLDDVPGRGAARAEALVELGRRAVSRSSS